MTHDGEEPIYEISHETNMFCEQIEDCSTLVAACNCTENMTGSEVDFYGTETLVRDGEIQVCDHVLICVSVGTTDDIPHVMRRRAEVFREISDALERQAKTIQIATDDSTSDFPRSEPLVDPVRFSFAIGVGIGLFYNVIIQGVAWLVL